MTDLMNAVFPVLAMLICVFTLGRMFLPARDGVPVRREPVISPGIYRLVLALVILLALAVRIYQFGAVPGGFNQDGAMAAVDAKALADYGTDRFGMRWPVHLTAWGYGQMSSLMSYLMAPFIKLMGLNPISARLPQLIVSLLGLAALYFFGRDAFGKNAALFILAFGAINPWHILQSRWALDCNLYPHFFLFGLLFLNKALKGRRRLLLCLSMLMFGLCMYCYGISIYTMPLFLVMACAYLLAKKKVSWAEAGLALVVWLAVAWPFIMVMAINFFKWDTIETPLFTMAYFPDSVRAGDMLFFSKNFLWQLKSNIMSLLEVTLFQGDDLLWNNIPAYGSMYKFSMPFALVGLVDLIKRRRRESGTMLLIFFLITGLWCGVVTNNVNINRLNIIYYPIIVLTAYGAYETVCYLPFLKGKKILALGLAGAYLVAFTLFSGMYFTGYAERIYRVFAGDFSRAIASLRESEAEKLYITTMCDGRPSLLVNEIRTMFWHQTDAEYFQGKSCPEGLLPYSERYTYCSMDELDIDPEQDAAYVLADSELEFFPEEDFELERYGYYYTAVPK